MKTPALLLLFLLSLTAFAQDDPPVAVCQDIVVQLDPSGNATITSNDVDGGSTDDIGIQSLSVTPSNFTCLDVGSNTVTLTVTDTAGQTDSCTATVTIQDTTAPSAVCQDITIQLDLSGNASITANDIDNGSSDACGIASLSISPSSFTCSDVGPNTVTLTVVDNNGNSSSCTATVTVDETTEPVTANCQDITVILDANGTASITADMLDNGSTGTGSCDSLSFTASQTTFGCADVFNPPAASLMLTGVIDGPLPGGLPKAVELYVIEDITDLSLYGLGSADDGGGSDGEEFTFTAASATAGSFIYVATESTEFNNFFGFNPDATTNAVNIDGNDAIELFFNGGVIDVFGDINIDGTNEPWEYTDGWAYRKSNTGPDGTVFSVNNWFYSQPDALDGELDNATAVAPIPVGSLLYFLSGTSAPVPVTLTVTNSSGGSDTCIANVTVIDNTPPVANCQDITVFLDANGVALFDADELDNTATPSSDACGQLTYTAEPSGFFCADVGVNAVTLTVTDAFGNQSSCSANVTVIDNLAPTVICQDITVQLDVNGNASITPADIDDDSSDNCGIASYSIDVSSFDCSSIGPNTVTLTVVDDFGNSDTCTATVTVEDTVPPDAICQDITIQLDASGLSSITAADIDGGSAAACGIASISASITNFDCTNLGSNNVTLEVEDNNGNLSSCVAVVTVVDNILPTAIASDITIQLNAAGNASITGTDVDNGSSDNCNIASLSVNPSSFDCSDVGAAVPVTFTATDESGNQSSTTINVTVEDVEPPTAVCQDITIDLGLAGQVSITGSDVDGGSSVSCGTAVLSIDTDTFDCTNIGQNNVTLTVTNASGLTDSCTAVVTVVDSTAPVVVCQDITVQLDAAGNASITPSQIDNGTSDNCSNFTLSLDNENFNCSNVGTNVVTLTAVDGFGNSDTCTAIVTVVDSVAPTAVCQNITVPLDVNGNVVITAAQVDGGSIDFCGIASMTIDNDTFSCNDLGANTVTLTVTDLSGNTDSCQATVTIEDSLAPTVVCQNITVQLDASGNAFITAADVDGGSTDACGIASMTISNGFFNCANIGANNVVLTVTDTSGNIDSCTAIVTVEDNVPPTAICQDISVALDASGTAFIIPADVDAGSSDACGVASVSIDINSFSCNDIGPNDVTVTVIDLNGNSTTCVAVVTVTDDIDPTVICPSDQNVNIPIGGQYTVPDYFANGLATAIDNCTDPVTDTEQNPVPGTTLDVGIYTVSLTVTDGSGNSVSCNFQLTVEELLGINDPDLERDIQLVPNPATTEIFIEVPDEIRPTAIRIFDLNGRLIKLFGPNETNTQLDIRDLASGMYMMLIETQSGKWVKKFIKE